MLADRLFESSTASEGFMLSPATNLKSCSRFYEALRTSDRISWLELAALAACGSVAALALFCIHLSWSVPGHAILRGVFPMAAGLAIVPRRSAGLLMTLAAALTSEVLHVGGIGEIQPAALASLLALGPMLDLATLGAPVGWRLYLRFAAAGIAANLVAFATRMGLTAMGYATPGSHQMERLGWLVPASFVLCGAIAGLLSAIAWFRLRSKT
jgi:hypothetical protein